MKFTSTATAENLSNKCRTATGFACLSVLCALAVWWILTSAHPYYFGDELAAFLYTGEENAFARNFQFLNQYKPRLIFNALWSLIADWQVARLHVAVLLAVLWVAVIILSYGIARIGLKASSLVAVLVAAIAAFSRFSVMLRYDYLSGSVELGSLLLFLVSLYYVIRGFERGFYPWTIAIVSASAVATVLVHERYIGGTVALAVSLATVSWFRKDKVALRSSLLAAGLIAVLPFGVFGVATRLLADLPITTGTVGQPMVLGAANIKIALQYASNVFLGTNFGQPWFVGNGLPRIILVFVVTASLVLWGAFVRCVLRRRTWNAQTLLVLLPLGAMIAVATLGGADRQEARWMTPVAVLAGLLVAATARERWAVVVLLFTLVVNVSYLALGGVGAIANIEASTYSRAIGETATTVAMKNGIGVVMRVREPDISWILRGANFGPTWSKPPGQLYALANGLNIRLVPESAVNMGDSHFDFGLINQVGSRHVQFSVVSGNKFSEIINPNRIANSVGVFVGAGKKWDNWHWANTPLLSDEGVQLSPGFDGFYPQKAASLAGKIVFYRAKALGSEPVPMRLQINWTNADDKLIFATIQVVQVSGEWKNYPLLLTPPEGAIMGNIYASLHNGTSGTVVLGSVRLLD
jgi:hypothetical protein